MNQSESTKQVRTNLILLGRRTSFSLEAGVWDALTEMCRERELSVDEMCEEIVKNAEPDESMAAAIRIAVLEHFMERAGVNDVTEGHGSNDSTSPKF
jgi:predicted DNA-binding ribbon-helix-helix protein